MKRIGICILLCCILFCGCVKKTYTLSLHQAVENITKIELLDTSDNTERLLYVLADSEIPLFVSALKDIKVGRYFNDPSTEYGKLAVKVYYADGYVDIIGTEINAYLDPSEKNIARDGWYYIMNVEDYIELFSRYINEDIIPF